MSTEIEESKQQPEPHNNDNNNNNDDDNNIPDLSLDSITDGQNERGIPVVKFMDDVDEFTQSFKPPVSAELLIGAYTDLFSKFKSYETSLSKKRATLQEKLPEIKKSLQLVQHLQQQQQQQQQQDSQQNTPISARFSLADTVYAKADLDVSAGVVNLWLGANVMLEYTYQEAIDLLQTKLRQAETDFKDVTHDLAFTRNQIITSEVTISRIYNWDVRRKRMKAELES